MLVVDGVHGYLLDNEQAYYRGLFINQVGDREKDLIVETMVTAERALGGRHTIEVAERAGDVAWSERVDGAAEVRDGALVVTSCRRDADGRASPRRRADARATLWAR